MIIASAPPAIVTRQVDSTLDRRGGTIQIPSADGVSAQLVYPASDMPDGEHIHIEANGPVGVELLGVQPFGGNANYAPYYQLTIALSGPAGVVHFYGTPKLILNIAKPMPTAHYGLQTRIASNYNIQTGATGGTSEPQFDLAHLPSIFKNGVLTVDLHNASLVVNISAIQLATTIEGRVEDALDKLQAYRRSRALDDLRTAIYAMQGTLDVHLFRVGAFTLKRRTFVSGWAQVLRAIEDAYDPKFDPDKRLPCPQLRLDNRAMSVLIPGYCDLTRTQEQNAAVRAKELQDLERYRVSYEDYRKVKQLDDLSTSIFETSLDLLGKVAPCGAPSDYAALDRIFVESGISDSRRIKIEAMLRDPSLDYITLPGQAVHALSTSLGGELASLDNVALASQQVEVGTKNGKINVILARDHNGNVLTYQVDEQTGAVTDLKGMMPFSFDGNGIGMSALDAKALIILYNKMLSGALDVLAPLEDLRSANFTIQQRNFDRSHSKPDTTYYEVYLPRTVPRNADNLPCGYYRNYRIETSTWSVAVEPLNC
ncbi:MAG TPA: hypothetical protein VFO29_12340 [Candidatus Rubrimentiphilum sp.]|nr:hypothetical protein [Candidatus Rubrimentiphilum sp.]